jgi:hypothetical protein
VRENLQGVFTPRSGAERVAEGLQPIKADRAANVFITRFSVEVSRGSTYVEEECTDVNRTKKDSFVLESMRVKWPILSFKAVT